MQGWNNTVKKVLPLIITGGVRSLADKMNKLGPLMRTQQEYQEYGSMTLGTALTPGW